jgi:hypothetical protein
MGKHVVGKIRFEDNSWTGVYQENGQLPEKKKLLLLSHISFLFDRRLKVAARDI